MAVGVRCCVSGWRCGFVTRYLSALIGSPVLGPLLSFPSPPPQATPCVGETRSGGVLARRSNEVDCRHGNADGCAAPTAPWVRTEASFLKDVLARWRPGRYIAGATVAPSDDPLCSGLLTSFCAGPRCPDSLFATLALRRLGFPSLWRHVCKATHNLGWPCVPRARP